MDSADGPTRGIPVAEQLGRPGRTELSVRLATIPQLESPSEVTFWFVLSNSTDQRIPPLTVYVQVRLGSGGWYVINRGIGG